MMGWIIKLFPGLAPCEFLLKVIGILAVILALMASGAILMHDRDEAVYQAGRAKAAEDVKAAQDKAIAAAIVAVQQDYQREKQVAEDLHRQEIGAANTRRAVAQNIAENSRNYNCKLDAAGFAAELEAFK